jgi:hypothetical protein
MRAAAALFDGPQRGQNLPLPFVSTALLRPQRAFRPYDLPLESSHSIRREMFGA